jgi:hypothetical protein
MLKLVDKRSLTDPALIVYSLISQKYVRSAWNFGFLSHFARAFYWIHKRVTSKIYSVFFPLQNEHRMSSVRHAVNKLEAIVYPCHRFPAQNALKWLEFWFINCIGVRNFSMACRTELIRRSFCREKCPLFESAAESSIQSISIFSGSKHSTRPTFPSHFGLHKGIEL